MSHTLNPDQGLRGPLMLIGTVLLLAMLGVAGVRVSGWNIHEPDAPARVFLSLAGASGSW